MLEDVRENQTEKLLAEARADLEEAAATFDEGQALGSAVAHSRVAMEEVLRAFITWHDEQPQADDLVTLTRQCLDLDGSLNAYFEEDAIAAEYPIFVKTEDSDDRIDESEANLYLTHARDVYEAVLERVPEELHPESNS